MGCASAASGSASAKLPETGPLRQSLSILFDPLRHVWGNRFRTLDRIPRGRLSGRFLTVVVVCSVVFLSGCDRPQPVQRGYRGTAAVQIYKYGQLQPLMELNRIPPPEPTDPYDPEIPLATVVNQNVQVLTDLNALEFARLMQALSTWVAPVQGCEYCHNTENLASDEKYTKVVAREMLKMTRDINTNWKSHVVNTGVTCWTCHRGQAVPSDIWFKTPEPRRPSSKMLGWKGGQNVAGVKINGNSALPYDPLTPFLDQEYQIAVQGTTALPAGNRQSIKQAEWTYSLMMYMSKSLGVNCTYCHHTRAFGAWDQSTPQRVTAWHGIRMVRKLNANYLNPLKPLYPASRLGPEGDAPKAACATCHKGSYKPLLGASMLDDYPELRGVIPGRLPESSTEPAPPEGATPAEAPTDRAASEPAATDGGATTEAVAPAATETTAEQPAAAAEPEAAGAPEAAAAEPAASAPQALAVTGDGSPPTVDLNATEQRIAALQARLDQERHALKQQLDLVREQRNAAVAAAEARPTVPEHEKALSDAEQRVRAAGARLDNERTALQQQLDLVREQRNAAVAAAEARPTVSEHEKALSDAEQRVRAARARLENERTALQQQLELVRAQREAAKADLDLRAKAVSEQYEKKVEALHERIAAGEARLAQERNALQQQLGVVRAQRDAAVEETKDSIARLKKELAEARATLDMTQREHAAELAALRAKLANAEEAVADLRVQIRAANAEHQQQLAEAKGSTARIQSLYEEAAEVGGRLTDEGILVSLGGEELQFPSGSAALPAHQMPTLEKTAQLLASRPDLTARIEGHTDSQGSAAINQPLSRQRAEAVMQALVERGIDASRLSAEGFGSSRPVADNATPQGRRKNRRVEIYLVRQQGGAPVVSD